jgi:hypothetical protein
LQPETPAAKSKRAARAEARRANREDRDAIPGELDTAEVEVARDTDEA